MFYYRVKNDSFGRAIADHGSIISTIDGYLIVSVTTAIDGQSHSLIEDIDAVLHPARYKNFWELRESLPFSVRVAIESAESTDVEVKTIMGDMRSAPILSRDDISFIQGVAVLQNKGLLTQQQASDILNY